MGLFNFRRTEAVFDQSKLKANLRMAISRIKIHQNKIVNSVKIQRRGLAELIAAGKNDSVRVKVEALIREDASLGGLEMLILFCDFISSRSQVIAACDKEMTSPPPDLKEAISSIIWASGRVDNIPELVAVRKQFELRYSKAFVESSMRNEEFSSNENIIERLGVSVPDNESCIKYIHGIASEFNVIFDASNLTPATFVAVADDREIIDTCELGDIKEIDGNDFEGFTTACGFRVPPIRKPRDELETYRGIEINFRPIKARYQRDQKSDSEMSSDDDDDGIPLPPQNNCFTGNFQRLTSTGQFQSTFSSRSPFNVSAAQSPTSPKSSFHCDRGQSFRLYASQGKGALLPKRGMGTLGGTFNDESFCRSVGEMTSTAVSLHSLTTPKSIVKQAYQELKTYLQTQCPSLHATDSALQSSKITIKKGKLIGSGGYANVYCGLSIPNNEIIAIKEFSMDTDSKSDLKSVEDEFALLRKLRHPNVVRYVSFEHSRSQGMCRIMLEFMSGGSTADMAYKFGPLPEHILKKFAKNIFSGLEFIHQEGIFHRDIKPANLLIDSTGRVKLADFGCSRKINEASSAVNHLLGTPIYMSPEFIKGRIHRKSDVWAAGCTLFELSTGYLPWHHTKIRDHLPLMFHITTSSETPLMMPEDDDREFSEEFVDFLSLCFERDVEKRPEAYDLLKHPWIVNLSETDVQFQHQLEEMCAEQCGNICKLLSTDILDSGSGTTERSPQEVYLSGSHYIKRTSMHSAVSSIADSPRLSRSPFGQWSRVGDSIGGGTYTGGIFGSSEDVQQFIILKEEGDHATLEIGTQKVWDPLGRTFDIDDVGFDGSGKIDSVNNSGEVCSSQSSPRLQSKPSFVCDMPKVMQLSFKQRDGHKVSMGLNIHPDDVSMKVIDRKPSFVVSMSDRIRSQIATAMVEENYEVDESEDGVDDADTNVLQRHVSMRVSTTSNPPLRASSMYHDSASSPSWTSPVRCPHSDNLSVYYSGDKKDINRKESPV